MSSHTPSQVYLSTRGGSYNLSFEDVVLKGLASDGGLFIPEEIPALPPSWATSWKDYSFQELAYEIFSLYISPSEIPSADLKDIIHRSYSTFRAPDIAPLVTLDQSRNLHLLELFHGPTFAFKDVALQFLGNLFEYFLVRRNRGKTGADREHLTVIGATSGDTGSAAIYGLRGKRDVSVFIMHPHGKVSPIQEAQMTTVLDTNVHNIAVDGVFDDCQDFVKALFADPETNRTHRLAAVNSINWARILAQITYYFSTYFQIVRLQQSYTPSNPPKIIFAVPTGNFGDILAGYFAHQMGLPITRLTIATNSNDILHRFFVTGAYTKKPATGPEVQNGFVEDGAKAHPEGAKETLSPAMDILVSSNFERLLWYLAYQTLSPEHSTVQERRKIAGQKVKGWLGELKTQGGFAVEPEILQAAKETFSSQRVDDNQTVATIRGTYDSEAAKDAGSKVLATRGMRVAGRYVLDPHSAVGIAAAIRTADDLDPQTRSETHQVALATAHPAKFSKAVEMALRDKPDFRFEEVLPEEFIGLEDKKRNMTILKPGETLEGLRNTITRELEAER
ncbi:MAG: threonine synthase [Bathelium mastoideum]|nr:MAG: threonine synthase [Bathelium mastoideum]KAI9686265.1 MAG: threonine synthase [Bathelium mastoideum]